MSELERLYIDSHYWGALGDIPEQIEVYGIWKRTYPRDMTPYNNLANLYRFLGRCEEALEESLTAVELGPEHVFVCLGRADEAEVALQRALERGFVHPIHTYAGYLIAKLRGQEDEFYVDNLGASAGTPLEAFAKGTHSRTLAQRGRMGDARALRDEAWEVFKRFGLLENLSRDTSRAAVMEAMFGNGAEASRLASEALTSSRAPEALYGAAVAFALLGEASEARSLAAELEQRWPQDTLVQATSVPAIRAVVAAEAGDPRAALDLLRAAEPYDSGAPDIVYLRGQIYLSLGEAEGALAEFQTIVDHPGVNAEHPVHALARLGMGRGHAMAGQESEAIARYEEFLEWWQDADPDVPIYQQARAEYDALRGTPRG